MLLQRSARRTWRLPGAPLHAASSMDDLSAALTRSVVGREAAWREQSGALTSGTHPDGAALSITYAVIVPRGAAETSDGTWHTIGRLPRGLASRHGSAVTAAVAHVRSRMDESPIAFRLLPAAFTLGELQEVYELLLNRRLHKASFRRALSSARLVEPTDEWRSEGRGRPAQFFRYVQRRHARVARSLRFDLLGG